MTQNSEHNNARFTKWLEILAGEDFSQKLHWSDKADLKFSVNNEGEDVNKPPCHRERLPSEEEAVNKIQTTRTSPGSAIQRYF